MTSWMWKASTAFLLLIVVFQHFSHVPTDSTIAGEGALGSPAIRIDPSWTYSWARDRNNHAFTAGQCEAAFPELYYEIDRAVEYWHGHEIKPQSLALSATTEGAVRVLIHNQRVRVIGTRGMQRKDFRKRISAVLNQVMRAVEGAEASGQLIPDIEFQMSVDDLPTLPSGNPTLWSFVRDLDNPRHERLWVAPDFNFYAAPPISSSFIEAQRKARAHDGPLVDKDPRVFWRGVNWTNPEVRDALLELTADKKWADVQAMAWKDNGRANFVPIDQLCNYVFPINTEGRSWSSRLTYILNCDSLPIIHEPKYTAHFYHLLDPGHNYVPVQRDFSDLESTVLHYLDNMDQAQEIADNAKKTFRERYITPAATACYWRRLFRSWSEVAFKPVIFEAAPGGHAAPSTVRGIPAEDFLMMHLDADYP